ncbi:MAG TPA: M56 family metallopeptidase [Gemmatimonas sp.]|uniref:M56 family metallopeptidase n=1 Tax=Gemmatimonas sp. TaxID=1962908 RepID=UPI002EDAA324
MNLSLADMAALIAAWTVTSALVAGALLVAASMAQPIARRALPSRPLWVVGLALTLAITLALPWRRPTAAPKAIETPEVTSQAVESPATAGWVGRLVQTTRATVGVAGTSLRSATVVGADLITRAPRAMQWAVVLAWPVASLTLFTIFALSYRRQSRALARSVPVNMQGATVHVSEVNGPVVFGVYQPRIVVPEWLLARDASEQALVVRHEQSHIEAHDPLLLIAACGVAVALPWNPAVWVMLSRLRFAIELDCDARVLARGVSPRSYGKLLIDLSAEPSMLGNPARMPISATAFSYRASHLERRLRTMTARSTSHLMLRRASVLALGAVATLAACKAELPTSAELQAMDVVAAEEKVGRVVTFDEAKAEYFLDGKLVERDVATGVPADQIATIDVRKQDGKQQIFVVTGKRADAASGATAGENSQILLRRKDSVGTVLEERRVATTEPRFTMGGKKPFDGIIILNGERSNESALSKLDPKSIESVEIVKGQAAITQYGNDGANGVIRVTTKK